jgi:exopolysaccharide production protein ExoQ
MMAHASLFRLLEKFFIVTVLVLYTGGPLPHFRAGQMDAIEGDSLFQLIYFSVYAITSFLALLRIKQVVRVAFTDKIMLLLVGFANLTAFWSFAPELTIRRGIALAGTTLFGIYLSSRFALDQLLRYVVCACLIILAFSLLFGLFLPQYGIMQEGFPGAWQGAFTHKNDLGRMMAFSLLMLFVVNFHHLWLRLLIYIGRVLAGGLIFLSTSVTALVVAGSVLIALLLARLLRWKSAVAIAACFSIIALGGLGLLYAWENADTILAGLGRDLTLTGRTELWAASIQAAQARLWIGHGYSTFWLGWGTESAQVWSAVGWPSPTAHNGWLDLALELGLIGTILFALTFFLAVYRAMVWIRLNRSPHAYWPLVLLFSILMLNLTESGFLGRNDIFWALQVAVTVGLPYQIEALRSKENGIRRHIPNTLTYPITTQAHVRRK